MKQSLLVAAVTAALALVAAPSSAQGPARSPEAGATARDVVTGQSRTRKTSGASRAARPARDRLRDSMPPGDLPPGYHKVDHQTGLPSPSIPSR
jgi:hypothetical protein